MYAEMRTQPDLDGGTFEAEELAAIPASEDDAMTCHICGCQMKLAGLFGGLEYLRCTNCFGVRTANSFVPVDDYPADESPDEQEAFDVIWPPVEIGGEA